MTGLFQIDEDQAYVPFASNVILFYIATFDDITDYYDSNHYHKSI